MEARPARKRKRNEGRAKSTPSLKEEKKQRKDSESAKQSEGNEDEQPTVLLPPEIWFQVFSILPNSSLFRTVGSVCHEW